MLVFLLRHDEQMAYPDSAVRVRADHDAELERGIFRHSVGRSDYAARRPVPCGRCELCAWHDDHTQQIRGVRALRAGYLRAEPVRASRQMQLRVDVAVRNVSVVRDMQTVIGQHLHAQVFLAVELPRACIRGLRIRQQVIRINRITHGIHLPSAVATLGFVLAVRRSAGLAH